MPTEPTPTPRRELEGDEARAAEIASRIKIVWVANDGSEDPLDAFVDLLASMWLARQDRGNVQCPGTEERREAG
ncbi:MAG: hypothetical protein JKY65_11420 [Planctomycetes bacterium]|nr:hypothetical protein [Planctomycetota bacterium]